MTRGFLQNKVKKHAKKLEVSNLKILNL